MRKKSVMDLGVLLDKPRQIEHYEKRFGIMAVEKGFITAEDLVRGLTVQVNEDLQKIPHRLLGEIFFEKGLMTDKQITEVLDGIFRKAKIR